MHERDRPSRGGTAPNPVPAAGRRVAGPLTTLADGINGIIYWLLAALMAAISILTFLQVLVRLALNASGINLSVPWSEELSRSLMIWLIFLGAAYACRRAQMIALTFVVDMVPRRLMRVMDGLAALLCILFYGLLVAVGLKATSFGWIEMSPVLQFPRAYVYLAMPVGMTIMILNTIALLCERGMFARDYRREPAVEEGAAT
ncbi:MAG: TRAP transporter small permease [Parvibaculaceae bacterium]